jgi:hypothetical protein
MSPGFGEDGGMKRRVTEMVDFLEICERALSGPIMTESDFDMKVFVPKLGQVLKQYDIRYDPNTPVPAIRYSL